MEVDIEVTDANDNAPFINDVPTSILVSEAALVGSQVITITATDKDAGNNGLFSFYGHSPDHKFSIDARTGVVKTISTFDYEQKSR